MMTQMGRLARAAARVLASSSVEQRNEALFQIRAAIAADRDAILAANEMDLEHARESGLEAALLARLALTPAQLGVLEEGLAQVVALRRHAVHRPPDRRAVAALLPRRQIQIARPLVETGIRSLGCLPGEGGGGCSGSAGATLLLGGPTLMDCECILILEIGK